MAVVLKDTTELLFLYRRQPMSQSQLPKYPRNDECRMSKFLLKGGAKSINFEMIYEETSEVLISVFARKIFNSRK